MQFADRLNNVETSAIRELFKLLGKPGIISFAGGFPDSAMFDVAGISAASQAALQQEPGAALQYGATEGYQPLREQIAAFMAAKGARDLAPDQLVVTTGSQQALDLLGKTMINPGDKVIVEGPTFLATIQCFRLYGAEVISAPIDAEGARVDALEKLIAEHQPKLVYLIPTFGNPSGAMLSLERRKKVLELAVKYQTLVVEDDPYGDLYFGEAPPPSLLALSSEVPGSRDWLAHCGSLSKVLSPGLRIGWLVAPAALLGRAVMCKQFSDALTRAARRCRGVPAAPGRPVPVGAPDRQGRRAGRCRRTGQAGHRPGRGLRSGRAVLRAEPRCHQLPPLVRHGRRGQDPRRHRPPGPGAQGMSVAGDGEHGGDEALQARVMELEIKASYTEDLLEQLNLTIYRQQQQIDRLLDELRDLRRRVPEGGPAGGAAHLRDELPPHY
jgi:aspartate/methionine/tyrosine aminotransferase/uncharacterized coiled-coil protein SlyX